MRVVEISWFFLLAGTHCGGIGNALRGCAGKILCFCHCELYFNAHGKALSEINNDNNTFGRIYGSSAIVEW